MPSNALFPGAVWVGGGDQTAFFFYFGSETEAGTSSVSHSDQNQLCILFFQLKSEFTDGQVLNVLFKQVCQICHKSLKGKYIKLHETIVSLGSKPRNNKCGRYYYTTDQLNLDSEGEGTHSFMDANIYLLSVKFQ